MSLDQNFGATGDAAKGKLKRSDSGTSSITNALTVTNVGA